MPNEKTTPKSEIIRALLLNQESLQAAMIAIRHYTSPNDDEELQLKALWEAVSRMLATQRSLLEALEKQL